MKLKGHQIKYFVENVLSDDWYFEEDSIYDDDGNFRLDLDKSYDASIFYLYYQGSSENYPFSDDNTSFDRLYKKYMKDSKKESLYILVPKELVSEIKEYLVSKGCKLE